MRTIQSFKPIVVALLLAALFAGCSRDPNVRKQRYFDSGMRSFNAQKYREAVIQFQNALQVDPRYADAHLQLARCYLKLEIYSGAYNALLRATDLQPNNLPAQLELGHLLLRAREFKRAQERADIVLRQNIRNAEARVLMADAYAGMGDYTAALRDMQEAIELDPKRAQSYLANARIQAAARQIEAAEASFKQAAQLDPKSVDVRLDMGNFYAQQHRWQESEDQIRRAIELDPQSPQTRAVLSRLFIVQGRKADAEQVLREAKKALPDNSEGYRLLGDFYFSTGDLDKALAEYVSLYQEHPKDLRVKKNYIQLLIVRDRLDEATRLNDEILKASAKDVDGLIYQGQILNHRKRPEEAIRALQSALRTEPDNALGHYELGSAFSQTGNMGRAESEWRDAVRLRPSLILAQKALANLALIKGDNDLLHSSAEQIITFEPFLPEGFIFRAAARLGRKDVTGAEADLKKAIELAPQSPVGYARMGGLRASQKQLGQAEKFFEQALEHDPNYVEALQGLVIIMMQQKQPAQALARVNTQIAKSPNNSAYYFLQARVFLSSKDLEKAEAALQKTTELDKNNLNAMLLLGQVQGARGSPEKALANYQRAVQENPRDARSFILMGILEDGRGNWQKAQEAYQKALQAQPDNPLAANNLAYSMLEHGGNTDVALSHAQVARRGMPEMTGFADTLAWAYCQKGSYASAISLLEEVIKKEPQNSLYHYHLGVAYQKSGDKARAREHLQRALQLDPKSPKANEARNALSALPAG